MTNGDLLTCVKCYTVNVFGKMPQVKHGSQNYWFWGCTNCNCKTMIYGQYATSIPVHYKEGKLPTPLSDKFKNSLSEEKQR